MLERCHYRHLLIYLFTPPIASFSSPVVTGSFTDRPIPIPHIALSHPPSSTPQRFNDFLYEITPLCSFILSSIHMIFSFSLFLHRYMYML